ncbi:PAC2 family protein [Corynebacterium gallinarum]|uniref:PAC2 family protein n=1 Tax=Corynebacterium gallinarum TaxID=2762214 RepID=A0A8I0HNW6_9CORY|nr:PAC2 family protein [Corynebacterium gallinarum]MBD8030249.1 PAC2 family protein [Corynebacterium gallinarum]NMB23439.1 PAC2 family protein [Corynebacterium sp.]
MSDNKESMYELEYPSPEVNGGGSEGPTLVVALQGYADAGHAVEASASHLMAALDHRLIASFNNDELIDYRSRRPTVVIDNNEVTEMDELQLGLHVVRDSDNKPFLVLSGPEPDLRWGAFTEAVSDLVDKFGVDQTICLYAAPMTVPHTRPTVVSAHGNCAELLKSRFSIDARISVPGSASLKLEKLLHTRGKNVAGYTVHVPHYVAASPYPAATLKLLQAVAETAELNLPLLSIERDAEKVQRQLTEQTSDSMEIQHVVGALERQYDEELERYREKNPQAVLPGETPVPSGDEIGAEFERFLANLDDSDNPDGPDSPDNPEDDGR